MELTLLAAAFAPALIAGVFLLPWQPWKHAEPGAWARRLAGVGVVLGFVTSLVLQEGFPEFPPVVADRWVPFLGLLSLWVVALPDLEELDWKGKLLLRFPMVGLILATVWQPLIKNETWGVQTGLAHFLIAGAMILVAWELLERFAARRPGGVFPLTMWLLVSGISVITVLDEALKYGILFGALAASQGAAAVVGFWGKTFRAHGAYSFMFFTLFFAMLVATQGWAYYDPTYDRFVLYFAAMVSAGTLDWVPALGRLSPWKRESLRLTLVALFVGAALAISLSSQSTDSDYGYY